MLNRNKYPYKLAVLKDRKGDMNKRWYITFGVFNVSKNCIQTKYDYEVNKQPDASSRRRFARNFIKEINAMLEEGYVVGVEQPKEHKVPTLNDAVYNLLEIKKSEYSKATYNSYNSKVSIFLEWIQNTYHHTLLLTEVTKRDVTNYLDEKAKDGKSPTTLNNYREALCAVFNDLMEREECLTENPFSGIKKRKEVVSHRNIAYRGEEKKTLINTIKVLDNELYLFVQFIYYTFMRPNEIRQLQVYNIQLEDNRIFIDGRKSKNKKDAFVTIPPSFKPALNELLKGKTSNSFLFPGKTAQMVSKNTMSDRHRKILKRFEFLGEHTLYSWKHTGVVDAYRSGVDIKSLQLQLRHYSLEETDTYLKSLGLYINKAILTKMPSII
ncbi:tyrosine-type recombinase/integrase [Plebeiibacterium sediminum]|uniref:Tyrosine-type recombinase/integrase n=1 Tax=Plebeiibacterium sediminum TaxID=2992112 RepID=A0AAE3SDG6_9BACT|nr:site-specific integrase [Plebeiobacterium sediminum]MCW3784951.1 tyrosine-type recombinase/integrase [Plebeiobacterium sediminum]